jgi:hypothetical protein
VPRIRMPATTSCSSCKIWGGPISFHEKNGQGPTASASSQRDWSSSIQCFIYSSPSAQSTRVFFPKYSWKYCSGIIKVDWCTWCTTVKQMSLAALKVKDPDNQLNTGHGILILTHADEEGALAGTSIETIVTAAVRVRRAL